MLEKLKKAADRVFNVKLVNGKPIPVSLENSMTDTKEIEKILRQIHGELKSQKRELETIRLSATSDIMQSVSTFHSRQVMSFRESLNVLATTDKSLARFGDGEFRLMQLSDFNLRFQANSPDLQVALREVFTSENDKLLIGFPQLFRDAHWSGVYQELWPNLKELILSSQSFANAHMTRPQAFSVLGDEAVRLWRKVWEGKKVVFVTGADSRFELIPELFDNLAGHETVLSKSVDAYTDLPRLTETLSDTNADMVLIALGPSGTILASKLANLGVRALDIGHLPNSYQNVFKGAQRPESIPVTRKA
ncbi:GT-D fold domain-containing glycosyltransferase [Glutamicibacter sp. 287]|uniref:GT-D fold domain-containing glycosyltransferase n=1 Tax=Glutamicibacter sp. 287 TaxID=3457732 RepID=UPI00403426F1